MRWAWGDQMRRATSLKELASVLDLSVATVSRALGGYADISPKTRERVQRTARELGYVPNVAGRMLVSGRSGFVGLVIKMRGPDFVDAYLGATVTGLSEGLAARGSDLMIATAPEQEPEIEVLRRLVQSRRVDGVVLTRIAEDDPRVRFLLDQGLPFVALGRTLAPLAPHPWIDVEGEAAFAEAFARLHALGHRHFGLVTISDPMTFARNRESGLAAAIAALGDPSVRLTQVSAPRYDADGHRAGIHRMLTAPDRPTAILGLFDELALAVLQAAAGIGLAVPDDLSVIGFDNVPASAYAVPGLTTFEPGNRDIGRAAADMLAGQLAGPSGPPPFLLRRATLVERGSHGPAPDRT